MEIQKYNIINQIKTLSKQLLVQGFNTQQIKTQIIYSTNQYLQTSHSIKQSDQLLIQQTNHQYSYLQKQSSHEQKQVNNNLYQQNHQVQENQQYSQEQQEQQQEDFIDPQMIQQFDQIQKEHGLIKHHSKSKQQQLDPLQQQFILNRQEQLIYPKSWQLHGQVNAKSRPINSVLKTDLIFKKGVSKSFKPTSSKNQSIQNMIKRRALDQLWDDRQMVKSIGHFKQNFTSLKNVQQTKDDRGLVQLYQEQFAQKVGLSQSKSDPLKDQINKIFKQVCYKLDALTHFNFKPKTTQQICIQPKQGLIFNQHTVVNKKSNRPKVEFISNKQIDKHSQHLKHKRTQRQRKKQRRRKAYNRAVQHGGMTKHVLEIKNKAQNNNKYNQQNYSKSKNFFKQMQQIVKK